MKKCKSCEVTKPLEDFYKHEGQKDGRDNTCKECRKAKLRESRAADPDKFKEIDRLRYQNDPRVRERHRRYHKTEEGKASLRRSHKKWIEANEEKRAAHILLNNAIRDGRAVKPEACGDCGKTDCRIEGHHDDYAKPLEVKWLCRECHLRHHKINTEVHSNE